MMELLRRLLFLPEGASTIAEDVDKLHFFVIGVTAIGAVGFLGAAVWFAFKFRRRSDQEFAPAVRAPKWLEWGFIGLLMSLFVLWWVIGFGQYTRMQRPPEGSLEVYVTAKQWMWKFAHPGGRSSVGVLVVPRSQPVKLIITSRDVIHSFYVPAFRIKRDAVPGRYGTAWFEADRRGTYRVMCAEYCGVSHSRMWASVVVLDPEEFESWLDGAMPDAVAEAQASQRLRDGRFGDRGNVDMIREGEAVAARYGCLNCHTVDGQSHIAPSWRGLFGTHEQLENGETVLVDEDYLTESMMEPEVKKVAGYRTVMPTYRGILPAPEVAALVEYIKSLEDVDQPPVVELPPVQARDVDSSVPVDGGAP